MVSKHEPLQLQEVLDSSKLITTVYPHSSSSKIDFIDAYLTIKHADEEISMVAMEMTYTRQHYVHEISAVQNCIQQYRKNTDAFSRRSVALLQGILTKLNIRVIEIHDLFSVISNSSTTSVPVIAGELVYTGSDSDEEIDACQTLKRLLGYSLNTLTFVLKITITHSIIIDCSNFIYLCMIILDIMYN